MALRTALLLALAGAALPRPAHAQNGAPPDTFADGGARTLVLDALRLRAGAAAGLESYEAAVTERVHVGLAITRRDPRRARTLYHREQVAHVRWQSAGDHTLRWLGRRTGKPVTGDDWADDAPFGMDFDIAEELGLSDIGIDLLFDPYGDRLDVFEGEFIQPVSAEGLLRYRFASGDTMQIRLPAPARTITLVEVIVTPRAVAWEFVEGSLWFDRDTGILVRAAYRPSGVWDHEVQEPGDLDDVPAFLKPGIGTVRFIVIEYGLYEQQWWLPRRIFAEGVFHWGDGLVRMPLAIEWTMADHQLNRAASPAITAPGLVRTGVARRGDDRRRERIDILADPAVDLARSPDLPPPLLDGEPANFSRTELRPLVYRIDEVAGPQEMPQPGLTRTVVSSLRYDRVRGLNARWNAELPGPVRLEPDVRLATAIPDVEATLTARRGRIALSAYRRIEDASDWNLADGLGNSVGTLLFGWDGGDYYRSAGASLGVELGGPTFSARASLFAEAQRPIDRQTSLSLAAIGDDSLRANLRADPLDAAGLRLALRGQLGSDSRRGVLHWLLDSDAALGDSHWARAHAAVALTGPLSRHFTGALELRGGLTANGAPAQRQFLLGGVGSLRGVSENAITGRAFWLLRAELGRGLPGLRANAFLDLGWAGDPAGPVSPTAGAGLGASFLDGLFRADLARGFAHAGVWRLYLYVDALL